MTRPSTEAWRNYLVFGMSDGRWGWGGWVGGGGGGGAAGCDNGVGVVDVGASWEVPPRLRDTLEEFLLDFVSPITYRIAPCANLPSI